MENAPAAAPDADPPLPLPPAAWHGASAWWSSGRLEHWGKELVTVFLGVYAAFALNNHQVHRQERVRREQILDWAQAEYSETLASVAREEDILRKAAEVFNRRVKAGEMPTLHPFNFITDYNPTDFTTMLQSGGFDLLDIQTVRAIRDVEGSLRQSVEVIEHDQRLSDTMILPNLGQPPGFFYDVTSHQLQPGFAWYPQYFETQAGLYKEMRGELEIVLAQIRHERERNR